ncbi:uncharacterized protein LOC130894663 [Diorhabda carinulata]|uniref:uncharacterized protein LOC130894663 n=1 Tax=Diorhabda carinulata TaxID=1163345 RepID=UPI0025A1A361|nr:uncharacterized protein LOC130894663 [Diorhabda carinulata]
MSSTNLPTVKNVIIIRGFDKISVTPDIYNRYQSIYQRDIKPDLSLDFDNEIENLENEKSSHTIYKPKSTIPLPTDYPIDIPKGLTRKNCEVYQNHEEFSKRFVDEILDTAVDTVVKKYKRAVVTDYKMSTASQKIFIWPTIAEFDRKKTGLRIVDWIDSTSVVEEKWVYSMIMLSSESNHVSDIYKYEAKFSLPTRCYPIAQATASVFFECDVSKVKPPYCNVEVTFQLESFSTKFNPNRHIITDALLFRVIDAKINIFKTFYF